MSWAYTGFSAGLGGAALTALDGEIVARCREELRFSPTIEWLAPETLPRESNKVRLIEIDNKLGL